MRKLLFIILSSLAVWAQAPSNVATTMLDGDNLTRNGALVKWPSQPGFTFSVYAFEEGENVSGYGACTATITPGFTWTELKQGIANNPNGNSYSDFPALDDLYGEGGNWCYGVSATNLITGVESPITVSPDRMLLGQYFYFRYCLQDPPYIPCDAHAGLKSMPVAGTWTVNRIRHGVSTPIPIHTISNNNGYQYFVQFRALSTDTVNGSLQLADGTVIPIDDMTGPAENPSRARNYVHFFLVVVDKSKKVIVTTDHQERFRETTPSGN